MAVEEERRRGRKQGMIERKRRWECVQVNHHKDIGGTVEEWEANGWRLFAYEAVGATTLVNHYLLFTREEARGE